MDDISLCSECGCMTKNVCGKCKKLKQYDTANDMGKTKLLMRCRDVGVKKMPKKKKIDVKQLLLTILVFIGLKFKELGIWSWRALIRILKWVGAILGLLIVIGAVVFAGMMVVSLIGKLTIPIWELVGMTWEFEHTGFRLWVDDYVGIGMLTIFSIVIPGAILYGVFHLLRWVYGLLSVFAWNIKTLIHNNWITAKEIVSKRRKNK